MPANGACTILISMEAQFEMPGNQARRLLVTSSYCTIFVTNNDLHYINSKMTTYSDHQ